MLIADERSIFETARIITETHARQLYVAEACGDDYDLRARVEALLRADERVGTFLDSPAVSFQTQVNDMHERPGDEIGPYKLVEQIGEGGFGIVFLAERLEPIRRLVALKILKPGMDTREVVRRFEAERQALAMMEHPNIAQVFNAGATSTGRPYFVMELVKGLPITRFSDAEGLDLRERLELFAEVCRAVQHAHQKGIIHRDLKPTNVLVAICDGKPTPKIIDFGVAKALGARLTERTLVTTLGGIVGTLEYMSPEQAELNARDIDTRADIYSLGVLLYELLTGTTPVTRERIRQTAMTETLRLIREEEPPRPSTRLSESSRARASTSEQNKLEPEKLSRKLRGDLDWIVMKALEKDRNRRYQTANALARDIERYLNDEAVEACPPSAAYRLRKFARRNKSELAGATLLAATLLAVVGTLGWAVRDRAVREDEAARDRQARRTAVEERVMLALEEAAKRHQEGRWKEALDAAKRADALAAAGEGDDETHRRARQVLDDMQMLANLESVRVRSTQNEAGFDLKEEDEGNTRAFQEYGIDIDALEIDDAARRIRARPIRYELGVLLDSWSYVRRRSPRRDPAQGTKDWKALLQVAMAADPDPWRDQFRKAVLDDDRKTLIELAASVPVSSLRAETVDRLGNALMVLGAIDEAIAFLMKGQRIYPHDYWINTNLGLCLQRLRPPQTDEAIRYFIAAVALRPQAAQSRYYLGVAFAGNGEVDRALATLATAADLSERTENVFRLYHSACCRAMIAAILAARSKGDLAEQQANRSVALLKQAIDVGYDDFTEMSLEKDLGSLRERNDFKRLLAELKAGLSHERAVPAPPAPADARDYVRQSQWDKAAAEYARADWSGSLSDEYFIYACLLLIRGDSEGYFRFCQDMIRHAAETKEPAAPYILARTCAIARDSPIDAIRIVEWANQTEHHPWDLHVRGLALYRAGEFDKALQSFTESKDGNWKYSGLNWFGLALVHRHLDHADEARQCLDRGLRWLEKEGQPSAERPTSLFPQDWLEAQLLRREAEELLNINPLP